MVSPKVPIAVAYGDGIGPEIMEAVLAILDEGGAFLDIHRVEIGEKIYLKGHRTGIESSAWETIKKCKVFLKAPITTPQGGGFKSLNVTIRTTLGLYANVRPCSAYAPFVETKHPEMDLVIIRENEEDLYAGIEYRQSPDVCESIKIISRQGCERITRYAFEYARHHGRKKVTCFTKDNIMKFTDGLFHKIFSQMATEYPDIENEHWIVDIGAAKLADTPELFDVLVLPNLYGDILSDVAAQISGSVGLAGSANIGDFGAMFEAIHGSAPRRAGQNVANPSGLLLAAIMMLVHVNQSEIATNIHNAWLTTIEEGIHTYDIFKEGISKKKVGTKEFAQAVIKNLGKKPKILTPANYTISEKLATLPTEHPIHVKRALVGVDVFIYAKETPDRLIKKMQTIATSPLNLSMISNRGVRIWPEGHKETFCIEQWRCRYMPEQKGDLATPDDILAVLDAVAHADCDIIKTENLYHFDDQPGYSSAEG